jgi:hypothetical protein
MSHFIKSGNTFKVAANASTDIHDVLPAGNYIVCTDMFGGLYLEQIDSFTTPGKIYGNSIKHADRILSTFTSRSSSTGVMLTGEKGSGKTLLARQLSIVGAMSGIPTLVINSAFKGDAFNKLLQDISQPCIALFDEFEKIYDREDQEAILTLLDGVFPSKKLFILTCNDKWRVDAHMRNRPGRIFYMLDFTGLDAAFIREYCNDNLKNKSHIDDVCNVSTLYDQFNFDMLKALVEEMNRYDEPPRESLKMLNIKAEYNDGADFTIELFKDDKKIDKARIDSGLTWSGNPLYGKVDVYFNKSEDPNDDDSGYDSYTFDVTNLHKIDPATKTYEFVEDNIKCVLKKIVTTHRYYMDAF